MAASEASSEHPSRWPQGEVPEIPCDFPEAYSAKRCWICGAWSTDRAPYTQAPEEHAIWMGYMPWDQGSAHGPRGLIDRLCKTVWCSGDWMARFNSLPQLKAASRSDPTVLHPFIEQRNVLIGMKVSNPSLRLRDRQVLAHKVSVNAREMAETGPSSSSCGGTRNFMAIRSLARLSPK